MPHGGGGSGEGCESLTVMLSLLKLYTLIAFCTQCYCLLNGQQYKASIFSKVLGNSNHSQDPGYL